MVQIKGFIERYKNRIFFRMFCLNLAIAVSLIVLYQLVFYGYFNHFFMGSVRSTLLGNATATQYLIDSNILGREPDIIRDHFVAKETTGGSLLSVGKAARMDSERVLAAARMLSALLTNYEYLDAVAVYLPEQQILFRDGFVRYLDREGAAARIPQEILDLQASGVSEAWMYEESDGRVAYVRSLPYFPYSGWETCYVALYTDCGGLQAQAGPQDFFIMQPDGALLTPQTTLGEEQLTHMARTVAAAGEGSGVLTLRQGLSSTLAAYVHSSATGLWYVFLVENSYGSRSIVRSTALLVALGTVLFLLYAVISYCATKKVHLPLQNILNHAVTVTGNSPANVADDYRLLESTVLQIDRLSEQLDSNTEIVFERIVRSLLDGTFDQELFVSHYRSCGILFERAYVLSVVVRLRPQPGEAEPDSAAAGLIQGLQRAGEALDLYPVWDPARGELDAIVNTDLWCEHAVVEQIRRLLCQATERSFVLAVGRNFELHEANIAQSMRDAAKVMEYRFLYPERDTLLYSDIQPDGRARIGEHFRQVKHVEELVRNKNVEMASKACDELLYSLREGYEIGYVRRTAQDLMLSVQMAVQQVSCGPCPPIDALGVQRLERPLSELCRYLTETALPAAGELFERCTSEQTLKKQMLAIIDSHVDDSLSLEFVAEQLHMKPSTFSKAFKSVTSVTFSDYVKQLKFERAVELLKEGNHPIKEISAMLGYSAPHYFIKIFKEQYGCTPRQYQLNYAQRTVAAEKSGAQS